MNDEERHARAEEWARAHVDTVKPYRASLRHLLADAFVAGCEAECRHHNAAIMELDEVIRGLREKLAEAEASEPPAPGCDDERQEAAVKYWQSELDGSMLLHHLNSVTPGGAIRDIVMRAYLAGCASPSEPADDGFEAVYAKALSSPAAAVYIGGPQDLFCNLVRQRCRQVYDITLQSQPKPGERRCEKCGWWQPSQCDMDAQLGWGKCTFGKVHDHEKLADALCHFSES